MAKYEVLNPLSIGGRRERGEIIELKDEVARGFDSLDLRKIEEPKSEVAEFDGVLKKYKIIGEIFPLNEDGTQQEEALEIGSIQEVPEEIGKGWVKDKLAKKVK